MKRKRLASNVCAAVSILVILSGCVSTGERQNRSIAELRHIVYKMDELMSKNLDRNKMLRERYLLIREKIENGELQLRLYDDDGASIINGMHFTYYLDEKEGIPYIGINDRYLKIYQTRPSLFYTILFHEMQHAYNYFENKEYFRSIKDDILEKFLYEMDATYVESLFVRDILKNNGFELSGFEKLLDASLEKDNLQAISLIFQTTDRILVYAMFDVARDKITKKQKLEKLASMGSDILKSYKTGKFDKEWNEYESLIALRSYSYYTPAVLLKIERIHVTAQTKDKIFTMNDYPEIEKFRDNMSEIVKNNVKLIDKVKGDIYSLSEKL